MATPATSHDAPASGAKGIITKRVGPLPVWGWVAIGAGAVGVLMILRRRGAAGKQVQQVGVDMAGGGAGGGGATTAPNPAAPAPSATGSNNFFDVFTKGGNYGDKFESAAWWAEQWRRFTNPGGPGGNAPQNYANATGADLNNFLRWLANPNPKGILVTPTSPGPGIPYILPTSLPLPAVQTAGASVPSPALSSFTFAGASSPSFVLARQTQ